MKIQPANAFVLLISESKRTFSCLIWKGKLFFLFINQFINETAVGLHVYRKGPPLGVGWVMQGWGGSYRGGVGHTRVRLVTKGWGGSCRGEVGHAGVGVRWVMQGWGSGGSYRGRMGWVIKNIKILKILNCWCYRVSNPPNQTQICRVLNFLNHDK